MRLFLLVLLSIVFSAQAFAANGQIDFSTVIVNQDGTPFLDCSEVDQAGKCNKTVEVTLGRLAATALNERFPDEKGLSGAEAVRRGALAMKIYNAKEMELTADETKLIKDCIAKLNYKTVAIYQAWKLLDPASVK